MTHGYSKTDAEGAPARSNFGKILPQLPNVPKRLRALPEGSIQGKHIPAQRVGLFRRPEEWTVYIDPPYLDATGYGYELARLGVMNIARKWDRAGARVVISEAEPLPLPGWRTIDITRGGSRSVWQSREILIVNR